MMSFDLAKLVEILASYAALIVAGLMGAITHIIIVPQPGLRRAIGALFIGTVCAIYLAPFTARILPLISPEDPEVVAGLGLFFGMSGVLIAELVIGTWQEFRGSSGFGQALRKAVARLLIAQAPGPVADPEAEIQNDKDGEPS